MVLDISNEMHMVSFHYVFVPRVNAQLDDFTKGWISHGISTANNRTLRQLWIMGMQGTAASGTTVSDEMFGVRNNIFSTCFKKKMSSMFKVIHYLDQQSIRWTRQWEVQETITFELVFLFFLF